jgi:hypothetical protein
MVDMARNYAYRMDHDTGFAPHVENDCFCSLSGCKDTTIEVWAEEGSWVIGIGGNGTGKPDRLIYAMRVDENLPYKKFKRLYPKESEYLTPRHAGTNVLISKNEFYYFGDHAIDLPKDLTHIIVDRHGCKCASYKDILRLKRHITENGYKLGRLGNPNNSEKSPRRLCENRCHSRRSKCS